MDFYSVEPYVAGMAAILLLASTPLLKWADTPPKIVPARVHNIDGLRGFLALGVVFHHGAIYHLYLLTGKSPLPPTRFYADIGQIGVAIFFMITGYLFWAQMLQARGRPDLIKLYVGRVFRIVPLYLFLVAIIFLTVGFLTGWKLREPPLRLVKDVVKWLAGGAIGPSNINGNESPSLLGGVTWTLQFEWMFYVSLAATSFFARKVIAGALFPVLGLLIAVALMDVYPNSIFLDAMLLFSIGMLTASAKRARAGKTLNVPQWALSTGILFCLALVPLAFYGIYSPLPILILGVAFASLVVFDGTLYGLLLTRPAKRLGDISYGIYLLQGPVLFFAFASPAIQSFAMASAWNHWAVVIIAALVLVMFATVTHVLIERPGIEAGQRVWPMIAPRRG